MSEAPPPGLCQRIGEADAIEWVIDAPARKNAITPEMLEWIATRCRALAGEIVVLRAEGPGFSSGFDLGALAEAEPSPGQLPDATLVAATTAMTIADATFIGVVHGFAIGAAVELLCACDIRIASEDATFRIPAARLGVVYHAEGITRLHAIFGAAITTRLLLLGDRIGAAQAEAAGALARCVPASALAEATRDVVDRLVGVDRVSLAANRDLLRMLRRTPLPEATRTAHEHARHEAYARLDRTTVRPAKG